MTPVRRPTRLLLAAATATAALALSACSPSESALDESTTSPNQVDEQSEDSTHSTSSEGVLDSLDAPALHNGVEPATPGTAYIDVEGTRLDFTVSSCDLIAGETGDRYIGLATGDTALGYAELRWDRSIGDGVGWAWIDEYVQLSLADDEAVSRFSNSLIQLEQDQDGTVSWDHGSAAELPVLRVQGPLATAAGTLAAAPVAESPLDGDFIASMHCG